MKAELRTEIYKMLKKPNSILQAWCFYYLEKKNIDVENILFYNLGSKYFAYLMASGVSFERSLSLPAPLEGLETDFSCHQCYKFLEENTSFLYWKQSQLLAQWKSIEIPSLSGQTNPGFIWYALKNYPLQYISDSRELPSQFGLKITLTYPSTAKRNNANLIKPIIDGVLVSFHIHAGENTEKLSRKLEQILHKPASILASLLTKGSRAVLGPRPLLIEKQDHKPQWNPADHQCVAVEVLFQRHLVQQWLISGELFTVEHVNGTQPH